MNKREGDENMMRVRERERETETETETERDRGERERGRKRRFHSNKQTEKLREMKKNGSLK